LHSQNPEFKAGFYLTINGTTPKYYQDQTGKFRCISYKQIMDWIINCRDMEGNTVRTIHIFDQYIDIIKSLIKISDMTELNLDLLKENKQVSSLLFRHQLDIQVLLVEYMREIKKVFLESIKSKLELFFKNENINVCVSIDTPVQGQNTLVIVLLTGEIIDREYEVYGLSFRFYIRDVYVKYDRGGAHGGSGNTIEIETLNAHCNINETNRILSNAYFEKVKENNTLNWDRIIDENVSIILKNLHDFQLQHTELIEG
jgi:hypothetical protein